MTDLESAKDLLGSEMRLTILEVERYKVEIDCLQERLSDIKALQDRCNDRLERLSKVKSAMDSLSHPTTA